MYFCFSPLRIFRFTVNLILKSRRGDVGSFSRSGTYSVRSENLSCVKTTTAIAGLSVPVSTCQYLSALVSTCQYPSVLVSTCQYLSVLVSTCQYLSVPVSTCQYLSVPVSTYFSTVGLQACRIFQLNLLFIPDSRFSRKYRLEIFRDLVFI